jgi:hypothetical protein
MKIKENCSNDFVEWESGPCYAKGVVEGPVWRGTGHYPVRSFASPLDEQFHVTIHFKRLDDLKTVFVVGANGIDHADNGSIYKYTFLPFLFAQSEGGLLSCLHPEGEAALAESCAHITPIASPCTVTTHQDWGWHLIDWATAVLDTLGAADSERIERILTLSNVHPILRPFWSLV